MFYFIYCLKVLLKLFEFRNFNENLTTVAYLNNSKHFLLIKYRKSLVNSSWAINFLTQGLLEVRALGFLLIHPGFFRFRAVPESKN